MPSRRMVRERTFDLRAREPGRGRDARSALAIPRAGWRDIAVRFVTEISKDRVGLTAAGVTFYTVLAMFPGMVLMVSIYGLATDPATITEHLALAEGLVPPAALGLIADELTRITERPGEGLGLAALAALALAIWSANGAVKALFMAMNVAYGERETRGFFPLTAVTMGFTLGGMVMLVIVANLVVLIPIALETMGLSAFGSVVATVLPTVVVFALLLTAISALYRFGPSRRNARWSWVSIGAVAASVLVIAVSGGFSYYLANWADYGATYGSLGAAIGLMMWLYLANFIIISGAELNAEIEHQTGEDTTIGDERPRGERGAHVADSVGESAV